MHEGDALAFLFHGVFEGGTRQTLGPRAAYWLDADANLIASFSAETNFLKCGRQLTLDEFQNLFRFRSSRLIIDAGINILRVFAEDNHIHFLRPFHRRGHTFEILHRAKTNIEVEHLPQSDVERTDATTHGSRERTFNAHEKLLERLNRVVRQPIIKSVLGGFTGEYFEPRNLFLSAVGFLNGCIKNLFAGGPDIGARS